MHRKKVKYYRKAKRATPKKIGKPFPFNDLPNEIKLMILEETGPESLLVCKDWYNLLVDDYRFKTKVSLSLLSPMEAVRDALSDPDKRKKEVLNDHFWTLFKESDWENVRGRGFSNMYCGEKISISTSCLKTAYFLLINDDISATCAFFMRKARYKNCIEDILKISATFDQTSIFIKLLQVGKTLKLTYNLVDSLIQSVRKGNLDILKQILKEYQPRPKHVNTLMGGAIVEGQLEILKELLCFADNNNVEYELASLFYQAVEFGHLDIVQYLLCKDLREVDIFLALEITRYYGHFHVFSFLTDFLVFVINDLPN